MSTENVQQQAEDTQLNDFGRLTLKFLQFGQNASNNLTEVWGEMSAKDWIRLIIIIGAYMLLRPYATKYLGKRQVEQMEEDDRKEKEKAKAKLSPNALRGEGNPYEDIDEYYDEAETTGAGWGEKARTRQRVMLKKLLEAEERRREEEEDDKDIADLLED